jgi:hypothetical protein
MTDMAQAISIEVTEPIPGAWCVKWWADDSELYTCYVQNGFSGVTSVIGAMIKYFTYIASLAAVLFIVINGILYSMAGINDSLKSGAKERITKTLIWLIILMMSWLILNAVAPWVYK